MSRVPRVDPGRAPVVFLVVAVALLATAGSAWAQQAQSSISGEFEIRLGNYEPGIDNEFSGVGPYETIFGAGGGLLFEIDYGYYVFRGFGALSVGMSVGILHKGGNGLNADGTQSIDETNFWMVPLRANVAYRFDELVRRWSIPFVPYAKLGLDAYIWWITSAAGIATYRDPDTGELSEGRSATFGWHTALGLQFLLDILAPSMSRGFDASAGVNNTYVFAEWLYADVDDFGSDSSIDLSDNTFMFGLAFEF